MVRSGSFMRIAACAATLALAAALAACAPAAEGPDSGTGSAAADAAAVQPTGDQAFDVAFATALAHAQALDIGAGRGYEWPALCLARAVPDAAASQLSDFAAALEQQVAACSGMMDEYASTEYAKTAIALTAVGSDARNAAGYDVLAGLSDLDFVKMQGVNGPIWALIALDCDPAYALPADAGGQDGAEAPAPATREALLQVVLDAQGDDGGWPYADDPAAPGVADLTGMALTALAPDYARGDPAATDAVERGLAFLSQAQQPDGGYAGEDGEASESAAQVVIALCSLGIDPGADERFAKEGGTVLDNLLSFKCDDGGFSHIQGGASDDVASDQALEALTAVWLLRTSQPALYRLA